MGTYRLIACLTVPLDHDPGDKVMEEEVKKRLKGIAKGAAVYFRYDMVDNIEQPPPEVQ